MPSLQDDHALIYAESRDAEERHRLRRHRLVSMGWGGLGTCVIALVLYTGWTIYQHDVAFHQMLSVVNTLWQERAQKQPPPAGR